LVGAQGDSFGVGNIATAVRTLLRLSRERAGFDERSKMLVGEELSADARFAQLIQLCTAHCPRFKAHACATVLQGLTVLQADFGVAQAIDATLAAQMVAVVEQQAGNMSPLETVRTLHALNMLEEAGAAAVPASGWAALVQAVERSASEKLHAWDVAKTLNALGKLGKRKAAEEEMAMSTAMSAAMSAEMPAATSAAVISSSAWAALGRALERTAPEIKLPLPLVKTLTVLGHLDSEAVEAAMSASGAWAAMGEAVERLAPEMKPQDAADALDALTKIKAAKAGVSASGWSALREAAGRTAKATPEMNPPPQHVADT